MQICGSTNDLFFRVVSVIGFEEQHVYLCFRQFVS